MIREIYFAGGCFWGMEKYLSLIPGVVSTEVGYANGKTENPTYEQVCRNNTGHAEAVKVQYDHEKLPLRVLLEKFLEAIDPVALNKQGPDVGTQYRSGIYYTDRAELDVIVQALHALQKRYAEKLAVVAEPLNQYYKAEEYHQGYLDKNPTGYCHITPALLKEAAMPPQYYDAHSGKEREPR